MVAWAAGSLLLFSNIYTSPRRHHIGSEFETEWRREFPFTSTGRQWGAYVVKAHSREEARAKVCRFRSVEWVGACMRVRGRGPPVGRVCGQGAHAGGGVRKGEEAHAWVFCPPLPD